MNTATTAAVLTIAPVSARRLANAAKRRDGGRAAAILAHAISRGGYEEDAKFETHANGRVYRADKASDAEIAALLRGNRVVDSFDLWENIGKDAVTKLIANGSLKRDANHNKFAQGNIYWITTKAADIYGIPATFQQPGGATVSLIEA
jgi:hypothetical protein